MEQDTALLFLANLINGREATKKGGTLAVRWLCLREDLREKYIEEATNVVAAWWAEEQEAKTARERPTPTT